MKTDGFYSGSYIKFSAVDGFTDEATYIVIRALDGSTKKVKASLDTLVIDVLLTSGAIMLAGQSAARFVGDFELYLNAKAAGLAC